MKKSKVLLENLHKYIGQYLKINKIIFKKKNKFQKIFIFKNKILGKILTINNIVQTTEYDEFIYHEMICLVPILSHPNPKEILIIGGGDGGCLKQIIKIPYIKKIKLVEIDKDIIKYSKKYLFEIHKNSFEDKRIKIIIEDGIKFLKKNKNLFDIIIIDGTDPIGPGKNLFNEKFYLYCKKSLSKNGILISQSGTFLQIKNLIKNIKNIKKIFKLTGFFNAPVPTYYGGNIFFIWASNKINIKKIHKNNIDWIKNNNKIFKYYNIKIHKNSFSIPQFLINKFKW